MRLELTPREARILSGGLAALDEMQKGVPTHLQLCTRAEIDAIAKKLRCEQALTLVRQEATSST